ncbi:MAG: hypothetical protein HY554_18500 [Elusimicrobia bacterium]|nr:hypothetical protein [Elusimicrobiota bacterium]
MRVTLLAAAVAFLASPAAAQGAVAFDAALSAGRAAIAGSLRRLQEARSTASAAAIESARRDAAAIESTAERARWRLQDVLRRARDQQDRSDRTDPFLDMDVRRLTRDLRELRDAAQRLATDAGRLEREAQPDPALVAPAERLESQTAALRWPLGDLASDARWGRYDLARAGYQLEAWDLERDAESASESAREAQASAQRLARKVR